MRKIIFSINYIIKNNGEKTENLVFLIQKTLKDSASTDTYLNYKIDNVSGRQREFDILIISTINSFKIK